MAESNTGEDEMIVVMKAGATEDQIVNVQKTIRELGFKDHRIHGEERSVVEIGRAHV